jgi:hypothetical protein
MCAAVWRCGLNFAIVVVIIIVPWWRGGVLGGGIAHPQPAGRLFNNGARFSYASATVTQGQRGRRPSVKTGRLAMANWIQLGTERGHSNGVGLATPAALGLRTSCASW